VAPLFNSLILAVSAAAQAAEPLSFSRDVAPILQQRCVACHCEEKSKGGYRLDTFEWLGKPGDSGDAPFSSGNPAQSPLHSLLVEADADARMPQKADPLPKAEISTIERWISEGARYDGKTVAQPLAELTRTRYLKPAPGNYPRPMPVTALAFSGDGNRLAVSGYREVLVFDMTDARPVQRIGGLPERITALAWSGHSGILAVAGGTPGRWGAVAIVRPEEKTSPKILCDLTESVLSLAMSADGRQLAAGCGDRTVRFFELPSGAQKRVLRPHADWVQSVAFHPSGKLLVSAGRDRTARVLDVGTGDVETTYRGHDSALTAVTFSADGTQVYTSARGGAGQIWGPAKADKRGDFKGFRGDVEALAGSHLGIAAGCTDGSVHLFQRGDPAPYFSFKGRGAPVSAIAVSADGFRIASGDADGEVTVWNTACGTWERKFPAQPTATGPR
jgi:WD40 repeat protein